MPATDVNQEAIQEAASAAWDGNWSQAVEAYRRALQTTPDDPQVLTGLALSLMELRQYDEALRTYERVSALVPGDPLPHEKMAEIYQSTGNAKAASAAYLAAGEIYLARKDLQRAIPNWEQAVLLDPSQARARMRLALVFERDSATHRRAIFEYLHLAQLFQQQGQLQRAEKALRRAIDLDPINTDARNAIDDLRHGKLIQVGAASEAVLPAAQKREDQNRPRIIDVEEEDRLLEALDEQQPARNPADEAAHYALGLLADSIWRGDVPDGAQVPLLRGIDAHQIGDVEAAIAAYNQALAAGVDNSELRFCLGVLYTYAHRFDEAVEMLGRVAGQLDYAMAGHLMLGQAYFGKGELLTAAQHLVQALQIADRQVQEAGDEKGYERMLTGLPDQPAERLGNIARSLAYYLDDPQWRIKLQKTLAGYAGQGRSSYVYDLIELIVEGGRPEIAECMQRIEHYLARNMIDMASLEAHYAIERAPDYLPAHRRLADILLKAGRTQDAVTKINLIANTYLIRGNADKAADQFAEVIKLWPADTAARQRVIGMLREQGRVEEALGQYIDLADLYHRMMADTEKAVAVYNEALDYAKRSSAPPAQTIPILRALADIENQRLNWRKALGHYERILQIEPGDESASLGIVDLRFQMGDVAAGVAALDAYIRQCITGGHTDRVVPTLEKQVRLRPDIIPLRQRLAEVYRQQGRVEEAVAQYDALGELLLEAGRREDSVAVIRKIISMGPADVEGYVQLLQQLESEKS